MSDKVNPVRQIVKDAIDRGIALEVSEIRALRSQSKKAIILFKSVFWVGVAIFNLALWAPLPFDINKPILYAIACAAMVTAIVVPILGLKKHQQNLELLKTTSRLLKKKNANEPGKVYIEQVKKQDRPFVVAEFEALDGCKWAPESKSD
jgi:hypothetical protein